MKLCWLLIFGIVQITVTFGFDERIMKDILSHKPPGFLDIFTKPKIPKTPASDIQIGIGGGSFGFGFSIGGHFGHRPAGGGTLPPKDKHRPDKQPETTWEEDKENVGPRPNWEDKTTDHHKDKDHHEDTDHHKDKDEQYEPEHHKDKDSNSKPEAYEDKNDPKLDWDEIGEMKEDQKSDDLMDSDLVADEIINPRLPRMSRVKRLVDSKVYHVPLKFLSNARPYKVQFHDHPNSLMKGNYI